MSKFIFKPGSDLAIKNGCLCPVLDNAYGKGAYGVGEVYWINGDCPLHGFKGVDYGKDGAEKKG